MVNVCGILVVCFTPVGYIVEMRLLEWWWYEYDAMYMLFAF